MRYPSKLLESTEEACAHDSLLARTRMALLRLEKEGHRAGWDQPANEPTIFAVEYDPARRYVSTRRSSGITRVLHSATARVGGDPGEGLVLTASVMERARRELTEVGVPASRDLLPGEVSERFYGFAVRCEGWSVVVEPGAAGAAEMLAASQEKRVHDHPDRVETRMVYLVARDGLTWAVVRQRRRPPVQAVVMLPEADEHRVTGLVMHGLGRMTASMVGNVFPIPPLAAYARDER